MVFWIKTIRDELHPAPGAQADQIELPPGAKGTPGPAGPETAAGEPAAADGTADVELAEYNAYLARLGNEVKGHGRWHGLR